MTRLRQLAERMPELPVRVLIGLSGGADSVALTLLAKEKSGPDGQITCVHVNHGLRGEASDGDEAFVRAFCEENGLPLLVYHPPLPVPCSEDEARSARRRCFRDAMDKCGAESLLLAHHEDDQAETLLMHLLRGAGLDGLAGMAQDSRQDGIRVLRPLLGFSKEELTGMLREEGRSWREDGSNADPAYLRNALRMRILPGMESLIPHAGHRLAQTAALLREDGDLLNRLARTALTELAGDPPETYLPLAGLCTLEMPILRRVLRLWWHLLRGEDLGERQLSLPQTDALCALLRGKPGDAANLPADCRAYRGYTHLHLLPAEGGMIGGIGLTAEADRPGDGKTCQAVPASLADHCVVRTRQPGDRIRPYGAQGHMSLQDYLVNRKVDAPFRDRIPLLALGDEILFVAGIGAGGVPPHDPQVPSRMAFARGDLPWLISGKETP